LIVIVCLTAITSLGAMAASKFNEIKDSVNSVGGGTR
jgi:hypothetical protein